MRKSRDYYGHTIYPMGPNNWGGRWEAYVGGTFKAASTLVEIKDIIRHEISYQKNGRLARPGERVA